METYLVFTILIIALGLFWFFFIRKDTIYWLVFIKLRDSKVSKKIDKHLQRIPKENKLLFENMGVELLDLDILGLTVNIDDNTVISAKKPDKIAELIEVEKLEQAKNVLQRFEKSSFALNSRTLLYSARMEVHLSGLRYLTGDDIDVFISLISSIESEVASNQS